ncbi:Glu-tRNA(Gln) amidotransferase subunit GatD [Methanococcoides sp. NM1]|uniref:Glu-tRNA(Gln) amidotransferase subunit GatD n=1 Tax=Methanococcoides sp. NM1 TaxID=1201013 RepID=UPI00108422C7|nr:Glu-tRNA(Gln) amidotransferase subunit GatD [Methanococcoides sp. NM1]
MEFELGDRIRIEKDGNVYEGIVMPTTTDHVVFKMVSGYNAGIDPEGATITLLEKAQPKASAKKAKAEKAKPSKKLPKVTILSTGGTIASKVDYRTGAVTAQFSADDIVDAIPEITEIANISGRVVYNILSENMKTEYWTELARAVAEEIENGADGIIVAHGTDTMMYSAAALSFMLKTPVPIVFVGSQRSADRPSSDNAMNAICATKVAVSDIAEVCVVMHDTTCDDRCAIHYGTKVRKMHTSRRDAFQSINSNPIGYVDYSTKKIETRQPYTKRGTHELEVKATLEPKCALVKFVPGADPDILSYYIDSGYKGIVIEGTGLGHVSTDWIPNIRRATEAGIPVVMTSQCLNGRVCDRVYDTGRDIQKAGAIEGEDMLPEVALVKLMWALGQGRNASEIAAVMSTSVEKEITECTLK